MLSVFGFLQILCTYKFEVCPHLLFIKHFLPPDTLDIFHLNLTLLQLGYAYIESSKRVQMKSMLRTPDSPDCDQNDDKNDQAVVWGGWCVTPGVMIPFHI